MAKLDEGPGSLRSVQTIKQFAGAQRRWAKKRSRIDSPSERRLPAVAENPSSVLKGPVAHWLDGAV